MIYVHTRKKPNWITHDKVCHTYYTPDGKNMKSNVIVMAKPLIFEVGCEKGTLRRPKWLIQAKAKAKLSLQCHITLKFPRVTNINFRLTISLNNQQIRLWELIKIFYQIHWTNSIRKCMEITLGNLYKVIYVDIGTERKNSPVSVIMQVKYWSTSLVMIWSKYNVTL